MNYKDRTGETVAAADLLPCAVCGTPTAPDSLRYYGGRCWPCFQAYTRTPPKTDPRMAGVIADAGEGPLAWARRIVLRVQRQVDPPSRGALATAREALEQHDRHRRQASE